MHVFFLPFPQFDLSKNLYIIAKFCATDYSVWLARINTYARGILNSFNSTVIYLYIIKTSICTYSSTYEAFAIHLLVDIYAGQILNYACNQELQSRRF